MPGRRTTDSGAWHGATSSERPTSRSRTGPPARSISIECGRTCRRSLLEHDGDPTSYGATGVGSPSTRRDRRPRRLAQRHRCPHRRPRAREGSGVRGRRDRGGSQLLSLRARAAGDPRIRFLGPVRGSETLEHLARADVFVFPTRFDIFGLSLVEAMGAGLACVVSRSAGGVDDLCLRGSTRSSSVVTTPPTGQLRSSGSLQTRCSAQNSVVGRPQPSRRDGHSITAPARSSRDSVSAQE